MAVAMTASIPMGVHANTITIPRDEYYTLYFSDKDGNPVSLTGDEFDRIDDAIHTDINADGTETITIPTTMDGMDGYNFTLIPLTRDDLDAIDNGGFDANSFYKEYFQNLKKSSSEAKAASKNSTGSANNHIHDYAWVRSTDATENTDAVIEYRCKGCGDIAAYKSVDNSAYALFLKDAAEKITKASANATVKIDTDKWLSLDKAVADAFDARKDVTLKLTYTQKGERKALEIPAGTDLSSLLDENGYIGFSRLAEHYAVPYVYGKN